MNKNILIIGTGPLACEMIRISKELSTRVGVSVTVHEMEKSTEDFAVTMGRSIESFHKLSNVLHELEVKEKPDKKSKYINKPRNNFKKG